MPRPLHVEIRSTQLLTDGFLKVRRYQFEVEKHCGGRLIITREVMLRGHAVGILGYDPQRDEIVLINEFRPGCFLAGDIAFTDNVAAGVVDDAESPLAAAVREMREETGLELRDPQLVHPGAYVSSGGTSEKVAIVFGFVDTSQAGGVHGNEHESEDILTVVLPAATFVERIRSAAITDLKTLVAGYWFAERWRELRR
ncbi:MAG: NUDIX domain-containing protein [Steroidobacteraceae bacterium]